MRNYVKMIFGKYHIHKDVPLLDTDGEIWAADEDEFWSAQETLRESFEQSGWTFTPGDASPAYWELNKANFVRIIKDFAQVNALLSYSQGSTAILTFESPRDTWSYGE